MECTERERLERIEGMLEQMHRKLFESNGERALVEIIRENTEWREKMNGLFKRAVAGIVALVIGGHGLDRLVDFLMQ